MDHLKEKKISEILVHRTSKRPYLDKYGYRQYEKRDYLIHYYKFLQKKVYTARRLLAKIIDFFIVFACLFFLKFFIPIGYIGLIALFTMILLNSYLESTKGTSIGKKITGLIVIDNNAKKPDFKLSLKRNFLALSNLLPYFGKTLVTLVQPHLQFYFDMKRNNIICNTYVLTPKDLAEVRQLQLDDDEDEWIRI